MFSQSLYRKYRPSNFNEVYGQAIAKKILINSIDHAKISHAYLFFGPRGTGKTSIAKMFARSVNCLAPVNGNCCEKCNNCLSSIDKNNVDIIEIDAASNNGVDEIRELRNKVNLVPNSLKYKVYIIDEVHMLSTGAFNALLKTLEEPPEHVIFILATTEIYKVPATIISRCQTIEFKNIDKKSMFERLSEISKAENINITDDAINEIVQNSNGGLRDAIGLLEKSSDYADEDVIDVNEIRSLLGLVTKNEIEQLIKMILNNETDLLISKIEDYSNTGKDLFKIVNDIIIELKNQIIETKNYDLIDMINIINEYHAKMKTSYNQDVIFEMLILKLTSKENKTNVRNYFPGNKINNKVDKNDAKILEKSVKNDNQASSINIDLINVRINNSFVDANKSELNDVKIKWKELEKYVFDSNVGALVCELVDCTPVVSSSKNLMISTSYESQATKINENLEKYESVLKEKINLSQVIVAISNDKWNTLKSEFVKKVKNNEKYSYVNESDLNKKSEYNNELNMKTDDNNVIIEKAKDLFGDINVN